MLVLKQHRIYREDLKNNPDVLYIFGDNLDRVGFGGQAAEMRGELNAFGVATKRAISHGDDSDYFFDTDTDAKEILQKEFDDLIEHIVHVKPVAIVVPSDGIGTGLALLDKNAPKLLKFINKNLKALEKL